MGQEKYRCKWENFPSPSDSRKIIQFAIATHRGAPKQAPIPYQYTLNVLGDLYDYLTGDKRKPKALPKSKTPPDPKRQHDMKQSRLRAIAYYSHDPYSNGFLTRRVFPKRFDFWSFSYVPPAWGALGEMLESHAEREFWPGQFSIVPNVRQNERLLPYLFEAERLKYDAVLTLPVVHSDGNAGGLLGAFAFYLSGSDDLPTPNDKLLREKTEAFIRAFAVSMKKHEKRIRSYPFPPNSLNDEALYWRRNRGFVGEILIQIADDQPMRIVKLKQIQTVVCQQLASTHFHTTIEKRDLDHEAVILVACALPEQIGDMQDAAIAAVGTALNGNGLASFTYSGPKN